MKMTLQNAINRGYNLLACTALALAGLAFGTVVFEEADLLDKVDDIGFLVIAAVAVIWYLVGRNRFKRSVVPIVLSGIAIHRAALGKVRQAVVLVVQFYLNRRHLAASAKAASAPEPSTISAESHN